ncbi:Rv3235 family protein [Kribbella sp. NPDC048915]|uniref:Rv3235 family protein n=1 Tax=Kribbella sp. NPDC048915 TaxID=3155148 RepID=UPI0033D66BE8
MSQPQNLQPDDLQLNGTHPTAPLSVVPTRTTDPAHHHPTLAHPDAPEAPMAVTPTSPTTKLTQPAGTPVAPVGAAMDPQQVLAEITRPRLSSVGGSGHSLPATARYADHLTHGALALRRQALTRLGLDPVSTHPNSKADPSRQLASATDPSRKLTVVPEVTPDPTSAESPQATTPATETPTTKAAGVKVARGTEAAGGQEQARELGTAPPLPEVRAWAGRMAQAVSEVLAGDRPISQLVRFTDDAVFMELNRRVRLLGLNSTADTRGAREKSMVRSVRVFMPEPFVAEVAAHVRHGQRSRAVAFRLEVRRHRWVCTALELG